MKIYQLTHNKEVMYKGTQDSCYMSLQRMFSTSAEHAIKWEGWKIEEIFCSPLEEKQILLDDKFYPVPCELLEDMRGGTNHNVKVRIEDTGEIKNANTYAMTYTGTTKGSKVNVLRNYLSDLL